MVANAKNFALIILSRDAAKREGERAEKIGTVAKTETKLEERESRQSSKPYGSNLIKT